MARNIPPADYIQHYFHCQRVGVEPVSSAIYLNERDNIVAAKGQQFWDDMIAERGKLGELGDIQEGLQSLVKAVFCRSKQGAIQKKLRELHAIYARECPRPVPLTTLLKKASTLTVEDLANFKGTTIERVETLLHGNHGKTGVARAEGNASR